MGHVDPHSPIAQALSRRTFLVAGATGLYGLDAAQLQAARDNSDATAGTGQRPARSTILIWLSGGTSHIDTFDLKPKAAREFRGPFEPIATSAPGVEISEHLPLLAKQAHRFSIIRSLGHFRRGTGSFRCTGPGVGSESVLDLARCAARRCQLGSPDRHLKYVLADKWGGACF